MMRNNSKMTPISKQVLAGKRERQIERERERLNF
jgi:hypothetical protein